ncbi:hypothetical protein B0H34DRAFT_777533, partial [Crassisporium funariophilum]
MPPIFLVLGGPLPSLHASWSIFRLALKWRFGTSPRHSGQSLCILPNGQLPSFAWTTTLSALILLARSAPVLWEAYMVLFRMLLRTFFGPKALDPSRNGLMIIFSSAFSESISPLTTPAVLNSMPSSPDTIPRLRARAPILASSGIWIVTRLAYRKRRRPNTWWPLIRGCPIQSIPSMKSKSYTGSYSMRRSFF